MVPESTLENAEKKHQEASAERTRTGRFYRPNVDILETPDELLLFADMPGAKSGEIDIRFEDGELAIYGPAATRQEADKSFLLVEYGVGDFYRTFRVSEQIDASKIQAEYRDGVLCLHLPKVEAVKPRKIAVQAH